MSNVDKENQLLNDLGGESQEVEGVSATQETNETQIVEGTGEETQFDESILTSEKPEASKEVKWAKSLEAWQSKLDKGTVEAEDIPSGILKHLEVQEKEEVINSRETIKTDLKTELKDELLYDNQIQSLKAISLNKQAQDRLAEKFKQYVSKGFNKGEALVEATSFLGLDKKTKGTKPGTALPSPSTKTSESLDHVQTSEDLQSLSPESQSDYFIKQAKRISGN